MRLHTISRPLGLQRPDRKWIGCAGYIAICTLMCVTNCQLRSAGFIFRTCPIGHAYVRDQLSVEISRVYLSNLPDWSGAADFEQLIYDLARKLAPQSRLVWSYLHVNRQLPGRLSRSVSIDDSVVLRWREKDRFPFYSYASARIAGASSSVDFGREHGPLQP